MTVHQTISHSERVLLPRALLGRRAGIELGQPVTLLCTDEPAIVVGRINLLDEQEEYLIQLVDVAIAPLRVQGHQIA